MSPGKRPVRDLMMIPIVWGLTIGVAFGCYEVISHPQVIHKPAMARYRDSVKGARVGINQAKEKSQEAPKDVNEKKI